MSGDRERLPAEFACFGIAGMPVVLCVPPDVVAVAGAEILRRVPCRVKRGSALFAYAEGNGGAGYRVSLAAAAEIGFHRSGREVELSRDVFYGIPDARIWVIVLFCFSVMNKTPFTIQTSKTADVSPLNLKNLKKADYLNTIYR